MPLPELEPSPSTQNDMLSPKARRPPYKCIDCAEGGPEVMSIRIVDIVNRRDWTNPFLRHIAPQIRCEHTDSAMSDLPIICGYMKYETRQEHLERHQRYVEQHPQYHLEVKSAASDIDCENGKAKVWLTMDVTGDPPTERREAVIVLYWRVKRNEWMYYRHRAMRGLSLQEA